MKKKHICEIFFFFLNYVIKFRKILIKKKRNKAVLVYPNQSAKLPFVLARELIHFAHHLLNLIKDRIHEKPLKTQIKIL